MTIRSPFKQPALKEAFDAGVQFFTSRHKNLFASNGQPHRLNGIASPFWRGYFNEPMKLIPEGTAAHAMFRAGQACRREYNVAFEHDGKFIPLGAERHYNNGSKT